MTKHRPTWMQPLNARLPKQPIKEDLTRQRTAFHIDSGSLTHSLAFKRLSHKTQVHSLASNDHLRTRLTHSLEAANIGRQVARYFCHKIGPKCFNQDRENEINFLSDMEELTFAACLAHDIGHPPFGHVGAALLRALSPKNHKFDDNKQVVRLLLNDAIEENFHVSAPLVAATLKKNKLVDNCYNTEVEQLTILLAKLNLTDLRHPVSYFMEAADDISYLTGDLMDFLSYKMSLEHFQSDKFSILEGKIEKLAAASADVFDLSKHFNLLKNNITPERVKNLSNAILKTALGNVFAVIDSFAVSFSNDLETLPVELSTFTQTNKSKVLFQGTMIEDTNLTFIPVPGKRKDIGPAILELKLNTYKNFILPDALIGAQNLHAKMVINSTWNFFKDKIENKKSDELLILPKDQRLFLENSLARGDMEVCLIDLISGMTDRYADAFWQKISNPITFRDVG